MGISLLDRLRQGFASRPKLSRLPPRRLHRFPLFGSLAGAFLGALAIVLLRDAARDLREIHASQDWRPTQCRVEIVTLARAHKFYTRLHGRYSYRWAGREFAGNRFIVIGASPDEWAQRARLKRLDAARTSGRSVRCFVDPEDPTRSVIDRDLTDRERVIGPLASVAAGGGGLLFASHRLWGLLGALRSRWRSRQAARRGRPWDANDEWRRRTCSPVLPFDAWASVSDVGLAIWMGAFFALGLPGGLWLVGAIGIPIAIGLLPWPAIHRSLQRRASGPLVLRLAEVPFHPGGLLRAELVCRTPAVVGDEMVFRLLCSREVETGSRYRLGYARTDDAVVEVRAPRTHWSVASNEVRIPVEIAIPAQLPGWGQRPRQGGEVYWQLEAWGGDVRGVDFGALFDVPVFDAEVAPKAVDRTRLVDG